MRNLMFSSFNESADQLAILPQTMACAECNLCTLVSCPEGLYPAQVTIASKKQAMAAKANLDGTDQNKAHPLIDYRRTPVKKIMTSSGA